MAWTRRRCLAALAAVAVPGAVLSALSTILEVIPNPAAPGTVGVVAGRGFPVRKTRLVYAGVAGAPFRPDRLGAFAWSFAVGTVEGDRPLTAQQFQNGRWVDVVTIAVRVGGGTATGVPVSPVPVPSPVPTPTPDPVPPSPTPPPSPDPTPTPDPPPGPSPTPSGSLPTVREFVYIATPTVARPQVGQWSTDPTFGTKVSMVAEGRKHHYARTSWANVDQTLGKLEDGTIFNFSTLAVVGTRSLPSEHQWSNVHPRVIYGMLGNGNEWRYLSDVLTGTVQVIRVFSGYTLVTLGWNEGTISDDDRIAVLAAENGATRNVLIYNIATDTILATINGAGVRPNWCTTSRKGNYAIVDWDATGTGAQEGVWQYDLTGAAVRQLSPWGGRHMDPALDKNGREVIAGWLAPNTTDIYLESVDLQTGAHTRLVGDLRSAWYSPGSHVSGRNTALNGYCLVSAMGRTTNKAGADVAALVALDGSGEYRPFAHQHSTTLVYEDLAKAVPSRDGRSIIWNTPWDGQMTTAAVVARMP